MNQINNNQKKYIKNIKENENKIKDIEMENKDLNINISK